MSIFNNSYFVYFVYLIYCLYFIHFVYFIFIYIYIYIYMYTCWSLTRICAGPLIWASRCGVVMLSKPNAKPQWKSKVCARSAILCTPSRLKIVSSDFAFEKCLWFQDVCKVCARCALLLRSYKLEINKLINT